MDESERPPPHAGERLTRDDVLRLLKQHGGPEGLDLSGRDLRKADLRDLDLHGARLDGANLQGADLTHRGLPKVTLHCTLSMLVMQAKALGCAREGNFAEMRMCRRKVA